MLLFSFQDLSSGINYKILKLFSSNVRILSQCDASFDFSPLDSLKIGFKIGTDTKNIELKLSKNVYSKLKSLAEKFSNYSTSRKNIDKITIINESYDKFRVY